MADYVNESLYPQSTNPLSNLSEVAGISNAVVSNKLHQQELQGQQGLSSLYANAPKDAQGNIDQNYLAQNAGRAGIKAPDIIEQAYRTQLTQQALQQQQIQTQKAKVSMMGASMLPVLKNPNATPTDMIAAMNDAQALSGGLISGKDYAPILRSMADNLTNAGPGQAAQTKALHDHAQQLIGQSLAMGGDVEAGQKMLYGTPGPNLDTGSSIQPGVTPVTGGFQPVGSPIQKDLTPSERATRVPVIGADDHGNPVRGSMPLGALPNPTGKGNSPGASSSPAGGAAPDAAAEPAPAGASKGTSNPPGFVQQEFRPGYSQSTEELGDASGTQLAGDRAAAGNSISTLTNMKMAYNALENAPTGKGSAETQNLKNFALWAFPKLADTEFGKTAANYDLAVSTLNDQARQLASQFGPKTNDNLDATFAAKPNTEQTKASALTLQEKIMSLTRAQYAKTLFHDQPFQGLNTGKIQFSPDDLSPDHYQTWNENFNRVIDPVALGADLMPKQKLAAYVKGLSTKPDAATGLSARDRFNNGYNLGVTYGLMDHVARSSTAMPWQKNQ